MKSLKSGTATKIRTFSRKTKISTEISIGCFGCHCKKFQFFWGFYWNENVSEQNVCTPGANFFNFLFLHKFCATCLKNFSSITYKFQANRPRLLIFNFLYHDIASILHFCEWILQKSLSFENVFPKKLQLRWLLGKPEVSIICK